MSEENNNSNQFWDTLKNCVLLFSLLVSILAIVIHFLGVPDAISKFQTAMNKIFTADKVQFWINLGNIVASAYFLSVFLKANTMSVSYHVDSNKEYDFCELAELDRDAATRSVGEGSRKKIEGFQRRVAALVIQYLWMVRLFAVSLVLLYLAIVISSFQPPVSGPNLRPITNFAILTNILNFAGGVIIFMAFWVLYRETLNDKDEDNRFWVIPLLLTLAYGVGLSGFSWLYRPGEPAYYFLNIVDLMAGAVNGLAMFLLFGRYVSLEQSLNETRSFREAFTDLFKPLPPLGSRKFYTKLVSFGIIFILPIYALAQPLFGSLEIELYGKNPKVFQTTVYGVCLVGKICFFHLTFLLVRKRLLQLYLYGAVSKVGNFHKLEDCLATNP